MVTLNLTKQSGLMQGAEQMRSDLAAMLRPGVHAVIDTTQLGDVDLSFLQTVEAARRHAAEQGGEVALSDPAGDQVRDALDRSGLSATFTPADRHFWLHEG